MNDTHQKPKKTSSSDVKTQQFNENGEFSLDLKDKTTRRHVMSKINRFKDFAVMA
ncbi:hypothetical protein ACRWQN_03330 [Shewanella sp. HL-SH8]|uniref:hypothetical protein n=1 Tax=Shewanella sp. HL-SH8 TaxID=3436242 RepID=UPI003EB971FA